MIATTLRRAYRSLTALVFGWSYFVSPLVHGQRSPVDAERGMVASASSLASQAGVEILRKGGNAIDASVATGLALAVTYPRAGNIGGGGFTVISLADGRSTVIDFRERAPGRATRDMYLDAQGNVVAGRSTVGSLAAGVPGTVAGFALAWEKYGSGKVSWSDLVEPARRLAADGFLVTPALARDLRASQKLFSAFPESQRVFLQNGKFLQPGDLWKQPDLAQTLARLQSIGPREFYEGETAKKLVAEMERSGGLISAEDLARYQATERAPLKGKYRGFALLTMPPPSSGGIALLQMLTMLEPYDLASLGHNSAAKIHLFTEVMRRAFRDRAEYLGDPDFVHVPVAGLLDTTYVRGLMASFDPEKATRSEGLKPGTPAGLRRVSATPPVLTPPTEATETTHFSVVDDAGNVASTTYTLNGLFGNGVTVTGAGFLLNNEMDDFTSKVGVKNMYGLIQGEANAIAPGKRPLSSMTPTIVLKEGKPFLVTGSPGGPTIITTTLLVVTHVIDHSMSITQAVDMPRFHHQWMPDVINYEPFLTSQDSVTLLQNKGHTLTARKLYPNDPEASARHWGDAESILIDPKTGIRRGANDLRSSDSAVIGY
ncbi:MAG TPA: gamma-glutamyltransferase [Opitutaceae bacterium]|nr:gamma-glutamyltransferase [Opitutaceae bacterium]